VREDERAVERGPGGNAAKTSGGSLNRDDRGGGTMFRIEAGSKRSCSSLSRREFLQVGAAGAIGLSLSESDLHATFSTGTNEHALIFLMLVGGPSQFETFDPKPDAPAEIRGPFGSIATAVPGVRVNEHLPRLAQRLDRVALVRSLHHDAAPIHETGQQLLQTGRLCRLADEHPHIGAVVARLRRSNGELPLFVVLPGPIANTGVSISHGQTAGSLGEPYEPFHLHADPGSDGFPPDEILDRAGRFVEKANRQASIHPADWARPIAGKTRRSFHLEDEPPARRDAYGRNTFGQSCLIARRLIEAGAKVVTINMFDSVFNRVSWDCHGTRPFSTLDDYQREVLPTFDAAISALIDDLECTGRLGSTLVVATGEFGRTPRINAAGGRDHWPGVWSAVIAGGGVCGGRVIGASDEIGAVPADRPVTPSELLATIYRSLGIDPTLTLVHADATIQPLCGGSVPIAEIFA
jgi:hypothetical protein